MSTLQNVLDLARESLNDADKTSWPDSKLLAYANDAIQRLVVMRPEIFLGQYTNLPSASLLTSDILPFSDRHKRAVADYILARAFMGETEAGSTEKSAAYLQLFGAEI